MHLYIRLAKMKPEKLFNMAANAEKGNPIALAIFREVTSSPNEAVSLTYYANLVKQVGQLS